MEPLVTQLRSGWQTGLVLAACLVLAGCTSPTPASAPPTVTASPQLASPSPTAPVVPDHVLVVIFENKSFQQVDGSAQAPYFAALAARSAVLTDFHAETHPSQPNYIALFSGSTQGVTSDHCPTRFAGKENLGRQLLDAGYTFAGYSEALPQQGFTGCGSGRYAAKHNPWVDFDNVPASANLPATALPVDYAKLPTVSFYIPDLCDDMHDCPLAKGDAWAKQALDPYARWAVQHNSLLIVTFDEDDNGPTNHIYALLCGSRTTPGRYNQPLNHYSLLATIEHWYGLPALGNAATAPLVDNAWSP